MGVSYCVCRVGKLSSISYTLVSHVLCSYRESDLARRHAMARSHS